MSPSRLHRFLNKPAGERRLLLSLAILLPLTGLSLRLAGVRHTCNWVLRFMPTRAGRDHARGEIERVRSVTHSVAIAARHMPYEVSCLRRSVCLWALLARQGIASQLMIGVSRPRGGFSAHAWVEWQGIVLNDDPGVRRHFIPIDWCNMDRAGSARTC